MKRRPHPEDEPATPLDLRRYDPAVWGEGLEAWGRWWDAREAWEAQTGEHADLDHDPAYPVPDAPFDPESI